jgi:hypothetical protein
VCLGEALGGAQIHPGAAPNDDGNLVFNFSLHKHFRSFYGFMLCGIQHGVRHRAEQLIPFNGALG